MLEQYADEIIFYAVFIVSGSFHEAAHAWSAWRLGDPTAHDHGRMTFNPLVHIDLFGTVIFPALLLYMNGICIGWMKPVPVYSPNLRNRRRDSLLVSLSGPFSNLLLAFLGAAVAWALAAAGVRLDDKIVSLLKAVIILNLVLAAFNLLPIPPLDGSSIVDFIRRDPNETYHRQAAIGFMVIIVLSYVGLFGRLWEIVLRTANVLVSNPLIPIALLGVFLAITVLFARNERPDGARPGRKRRGL